MTTPDPKTICILRLSAIGDCCHALAIVRTLQKHLPEAKLTWVIGKTEAGLMSGLDNVELLVYDKRSGRNGRRQLSAELGNRQFDVLLNMHASWRANLVSRVIRSPRRIGFDRERARDWQWLFSNERITPQHQPHVIDGMFGFTEKIGIQDREYDWRLPLEDEHYDVARPFRDAPLLVISPCSSERARNFRNWPVEHFIAVARVAVEQHGAHVVITGGGSDIEHRYAGAIAQATPGAVNLVGKTSLKQLAALIDSAKAVLCPDSGPAHIATATATPVIGLYATSNPRRTGPSKNAQFTINRYPEACQRYLGKGVDDLRWGQRVRHPEAMALIPADAVIEKVAALLSS